MSARLQAYSQHSGGKHFEIHVTHHDSISRANGFNRPVRRTVRTFTVDGQRLRRAEWLALKNSTERSAS